ncbi:MAG: PA0069 family radical SAM protein [Sandaracinaceae bacterium]
MPLPKQVDNPPNPYESWSLAWDTPPPEATLQVFEERTKSVVSENDSPDIGFRFSVNPYRGCGHGCAYCYARPTHQYWGFGAGTDFERKIIVKVDAPERLAAELRRPKLRGAPIVFSGNTDCYQPLEASYRLTRGCLEACRRAGNPVGVITKGAVIRRDIDVLAALEAEVGARVTISIAFADDATGRAFDPHASPIGARFETVRRLAEAGVRVGVSLAPIIPGVNDSMVPAILERARAAGARHAFMTMLRLAREVRPVFEARLRAALPDRADKVLSAVREVRGGAMNDSRFGHRMRGEGERWRVIEQLFETHRRRLGFEELSVADDLGPRPEAAGAGRRQLSIVY